MSGLHILGDAHPLHPNLRRIVAGRDIPSQGVRKGDIGGWVERVSQVSGNAWVSGNAQVFDNARIFGNANVSHPSHVFTISGLPSGHVTLARTTSGHGLRVGCWVGTIETLRALVRSDQGWPEARGVECDRRRPGLLAAAALCESVVTSWEVSA